MSPSLQKYLESSSAHNPWFGISLGLMGVILGYVIGSMHANALQVTTRIGTNQQIAQVPPPPPAAPTPPPAPSDPATIDDDPIMGEENATVTLIEFTDYQCPFCQRHFSDTYGQLKKNYVDTGKIRYVVRDYPLSFHPHAGKAAEASECADDQGKFWEMHDKLFQNTTTWSGLSDAVPTFKQYASELKLNTSAFNECLDSGKHAAEIAKDQADGSASGVSGTPGFWVVDENGEGKYISGAQPYSAFQQAIDAML